MAVVAAASKIETVCVDAALPAICVKPVMPEAVPAASGAHSPRPQWHSQ
jgi:hypothetical protein